MLLKTTSYARGGLLGNPSDGYFGKTIAFSIADFGVALTMYESPRLQIVPGEVDDAVFADLDALVEEVQRYGYYGGIRLIKATIRVFAEYCREHGIALPARNFTVEYHSNIPRLVGLGGSSAICTATFKSLMRFYDVAIPLERMPTLCWLAENRELGIACGMQDRVIQVYEGVVFMDFEQKYFESNQYGRYHVMPRRLLPPLFLAYDPQRAEFSGIYHRRLRVLFEERKKDIVAAMSEFADIAQRGFDALVAGRMDAFAALIDANFDLRDRIFDVAPENKRMVMQARAAGASAKFAGSGGAIIGTYEDEAMFARVRSMLAEIGCRTIRPTIPPGILEEDAVAATPTPGV